MAGVTVQKGGVRAVVKTLLVAVACGCALGAILAVSTGCAVREPCYQVIAVTPATGEVLVFNACDGTFEMRSLAPAQPAARGDGGSRPHGAGFKCKGKWGSTWCRAIEPHASSAFGVWV
jgi:hypothetical protein